MVYRQSMLRRGGGRSESNGPATLADLVKMATASATWLVYGSAGLGTPHHLLASMFTRAAGINGVHVPYRGVTPALNDLVAGRIQATFCSLGAALGLLNSGDVRALAVTDERLATMPTVPSFAELGFPDLKDVAWLGFIAPAGLPEPIAQRLSHDIIEVVRSSEGRKRIEDLFLRPDPKPYDEVRGYVASEVARWAPIVRASGAEVN